MRTLEFLILFCAGPIGWLVLFFREPRQPPKKPAQPKGQRQQIDQRRKRRWSKAPDDQPSKADRRCTRTRSPEVRALRSARAAKWRAQQQIEQRRKHR